MASFEEVDNFYKRHLVNKEVRSSKTKEFGDILFRILFAANEITLHVAMLARNKASGFTESEYWNNAEKERSEGIIEEGLKELRRLVGEITELVSQPKVEKLI